MATNHVTISRASQIKIKTSVGLLQTIGAGPATQETSVVDQEYSVAFIGYSQGQQAIAANISDFNLVSSCNMCIISSDQPLDITYTVAGGTAVTMPNTKRFSYESTVACSISISNPSSSTVANVDFVASAT